MVNYKGEDKHYTLTFWERVRRGHAKEYVLGITERDSEGRERPVRTVITGNSIKDLVDNLDKNRLLIRRGDEIKTISGARMASGMDCIDNPIGPKEMLELDSYLHS